MASFNLTVVDSSPLITYSPAGSWIDTPPNDVLAASYSGGSFHTTTTQGATATIKFNGTGISIFGGNRPNYGTYSLVVDGQLIVASTAESTVPSTRQLLGTVSGLINGPHTAVFANTNGQPVDIDSIELESQVGAFGSGVTQKIFDDSNSVITYLPSPSAWQMTTAPTFLNGTLHSSQTPGASASIWFSGEAVALYGTVSPNHANVHIVIDGQSLILPGGSGGQVSAVRPQVLLYYQNNLVPGQHMLVLSGKSTPLTGSSIDLDSITAFAATGVSSINLSTLVSNGSTAAMDSLQPNYYSIPPYFASNTRVSSTIIPTPVSTSDNLQPKSNTFLSTGTMIGAVVGGIVGLLLLVALLVLGLLYQRRKRKNRLVEASLVTVSPEWPMQFDPKTLAETSSQDFAKLENIVFPFPPPTVRMIAMQRPATPSLASLTSKGSHSRDSSVVSSASITPLITPVPKLNVPQPNIARTPVLTSVGLPRVVKKQVRFKPVNEHFDANTPSRPTRPPTIDFGDLDPE